MSYFILQLQPIASFFLISISTVCLLFTLVFIMSFSTKIDPEKSSMYECGFQSFSETGFPFEVQFSLIAVLFLIFDIEVLYLYPAVYCFVELPFFSCCLLSTVFCILFLGILYEISRDVLSFSIITITNTSILELDIISHKSC